MLNGKKMKGRICELEGKPIRNLIMCPRDVPLTQKFMCDEDCVYCGKEEAEIKTESVRKS